MYAVALRGGPWRLAFILTALCACAAYPAVASWPATLAPNAASVEDRDDTVVTVTIDTGVDLDQRNGRAVLTGTVKCSRDETFDLAVTLEQEQRNEQAITDVRAATLVPVDCTTSLRPWSAAMALTNGAFHIGSARASAQITEAPAWVAPIAATKTVKLSLGRK